MSDDEESITSLNIFPNEILLYLFEFFTVKSLVISRQVCKRWKDLIDNMLSTDNAWEINCAKDFPRNYKIARQQSPFCETWYDLYKALSLWEHLDSAKDSIDEFCHSTTVADEIRSIQLLDKGLICVHRRSTVIYCDIQTQDFSDARPLIDGDFSRVFEQGDILILHGSHLDLAISKWQHAPEETVYERQELVAIYHNIKMFTVYDKDIYFANLDNQMFSLGIHSESPLIKTYKNTLDSSLVALSVYNKLFHVVTIGRSVYAFINGKFELQFMLDSVSNVIHTLYQYDFLENIDWRVFYIWLAQLGIKIPDGPLRFISSMRIHGDIFLVGSQCGVLRIYYKPFINGELNLFDSKPLKQFNFSQRLDIPILSLHPILKLEVCEEKHGHKILVAMPRKILLINFSHNYDCCISKALLPYEKWENKFFAKPIPDFPPD